MPTENGYLLKTHKGRAGMETASAGSIQRRVKHADSREEFLEVDCRARSVDERLPTAAQVIALKSDGRFPGCLRPERR